MAPLTSPVAAWPLPLWIAHRGAGTLAPENTLAAFQRGAAHGYRAFECDVTLSADDLPFLLHDATLDRTTNGTGPAAAQPWQSLSQLDAGAWHSLAHAGAPLLSLQALAAHALAQGLQLDLEIKPSAGTEVRTGRRVAAEVARLWAGAATLPVLSSFQPEALQGAMAEAPQLLRALLLERLWPGWLDTALRLGCAAVITQHRLMDDVLIGDLRRAGLRALAYTVNDPADAQRLLSLGIDGLITDAVDRFDPHAPAPMAG